MNDAMSTDGSEEERARELRRLAASAVHRAPLDAALFLQKESDETVARVLERLEAPLALRILARLPPERGEALGAVITTRLGDQWVLNLSYPEESVGRIMAPVVAAFGPEMEVTEATEALRKHARVGELIYAFVVDAEGRLAGVLPMRELLFAEPGERLADVMVKDPFFFTAETPIEEATQAVVRRHYPIYPVCDEAGKLIGTVRGYALFERHADELSAQPGQMVGVDKEERLDTPWTTCLKLRHPWLQLNLFTAFAAAFVVALFESTITQLVVLAAFLPVLAGQSGNTGCQALAVTLRGITREEVKPGLTGALVVKEARLGLCNGVLVGLVAALAMLGYAATHHTGASLLLAAVVLLAMIGSCVASGVAGVIIPLALKRAGADPAMASSIFLTTATDIASIGLLLGLATLLVP